MKTIEKTATAFVICMIAYLIFRAIATPMPSYSIWQIENLPTLLMIQQILVVMACLLAMLTMLLLIKDKVS